MIRFAEPSFLWLALLVVVVVVAASRLRAMAPWRRWTIVALRAVIVLLLVFGLARMELRRTAKELAVIYVADISDSIPPQLKTQQIEVIDRLSRRASTNDLTGVVVFGGSPSLETSPVKRFEFENRFLSSVRTDNTDVSAALRLAMAAFPSNTLRRVVLLSDGNENVGSALDVARQARNAGIPIDILPLTYDASRDVQIDKVIVPQRTVADAPFDLTVFLSADQESEGTLRILRDGAVIAEERVTVRPGRNPPLTISQRLTDSGFHTYTATIEVDGDPRPQNNRAEAFTYLAGEPKVLIVEGSTRIDDARFLVAGLRVENIQAEVVTPAQMPSSIEGLQEYDSIVLSNVPAAALTLDRMKTLERAVHDFGVGLVMVGGENSFGAGGWTDTPIELALPVSMDIKQKKILPNGALVVILHTCEIPDGNAWAREVTIAALNVLSAQDYFGVNYYGPPPGGGAMRFGDVWLWDNPPIQQVGDKTRMRNLIRGVQPLDMLNYAPTMEMAYEELLKVKAQTKHIVIISDGDASPPSTATIQGIRNAGITISTVCIAPHSPRDAAYMEDLAFQGGGNFYYPRDSRELPRIFTKEATIVRQSLIREETIAPQQNAPSEIMLGIGALPAVEGLVVTMPKDLATLVLVGEGEDPILAHWRYGLGKTVAFTSDAKDRWAARWVQSPVYSKFWSQLIRWSLRESSSSSLQVQTDVSGSMGRVVVDALDENGNYINFLDLDATVVGPDLDPQSVDIRQVAPGRYEATFPAPERGTYMVSLVERGKDGEVISYATSGVAVSYSPEYQVNTSSEEFLTRLAEAAGGEVVEPASYNPYRRNLSPIRTPEPLWPGLLLAAVLLIPLDIFLRRVYMTLEDFRNFLAYFLPFLAKKDTKSEELAASRMESLKAAKGRATQTREEQAEDAAAREEFRKRLTERENDDRSVFDESSKAGGDATRRATKQTITAQDSPVDRPPVGGMDSLMEAKRRAQQRKKK